jgi:hypothetical protein
MKRGVSARVMLFVSVATALIAASAASAPAGAPTASIALVERSGPGAQTSQTVTELAYVGTEVTNRVTSTIVTGPDGTPHLLTRDVVPIATAPPCSHLGEDQNSSMCPLAGISQASFILNGGNDTLLARLDRQVIASGGAGADWFTTSPLSDLLKGGPGADRLGGGAGADVISGDAGNDRLSGGAGRDRCAGGAGRKDRAKGCEKAGGVP